MPQNYAVPKHKIFVNLIVRHQVRLCTSHDFTAL